MSAVNTNSSSTQNTNSSMSDYKTSSYINIVAFLLTTYVYYILLKPRLTYEILTSPEDYPVYLSNSYAFLAVYLLLVIIIQVMVNMNVITAKCGGNIMDNIGIAGVITFMPWILIFGVIMVVITIYPGFKSAFSDVLGYYWVSSSANKLITELLISQEVQPNIDSDNSLDDVAKKKMQSAADAIIKICGNSAILINQMTPRNFDDFWKMLTPLMKQQYKPINGTNEIPAEAKEKQKQLFELVISKDNIGEALWYIYTGLLVTSIVRLNISTKDCANSVKNMEANAEKYKKQQQKIKEDSLAATTQVYTM